MVDPGFDLGGRHRQCDGHLNKDNGPPAVCPGRPPREGRARCTEAPVGHGRGRSGSGRVTADGRAARLPGLSKGCSLRGAGPGRVGCVGSARCGRGGRGARGCLVTHVLLPVTVLLRRADAVGGDRRRADGAGGRPWSPADRGAGWVCRRARSAAGCGGGPPGWRRSGCISRWWPGWPGWTWRCRRRSASPWRDVARGGGRGDGGGDRPVRDGRGDRPGDGVAGRVGVQWWSASLTRVGRWVRWVPVPTRVAPDGGAVGPGSSRGSLPGNTCRVILPTTKLGSALW